MEYFDILTAEGQATGKTAERDQVHSQGLWHAAIDIWLINDKNKLLLQKRAQNKDSYPNLWEVSCSGHILSGETPEQAAVRELYEELGLTIEPSQLKKLFQTTECYTLNNGTFINNEYKTVFLLPTTETDFQFNDGEVTAIKWLTIDELKVHQNAPDFVPHPKTYPMLFQSLA